MSAENSKPITRLVIPHGNKQYIAHVDPTNVAWEAVAQAFEIWKIAELFNVFDSVKLNSGLLTTLKDLQPRRSLG